MDNIRIKAVLIMIFAGFVMAAAGFGFSLAEAAGSGAYLLPALLLAGGLVAGAALYAKFIAKPDDKISEQSQHLQELNNKIQNQAEQNQAEQNNKYERLAKENLLLQAELTDALRELQEVLDADRARYSTLAIKSHEMRTALNVVIGLSEIILNSGEVKGALYDRLDNIRVSGLTLLNIADEILDISKIEPYKFEMYAPKIGGHVSDSLHSSNMKNKKQPATVPERSLLLELREACREYNMDRVDQAMLQLEQFEYERGTKLIVWLREQVDAMNFEAIYSGGWINGVSLEAQRGDSCAAS